MQRLAPVLTLVTGCTPSGGTTRDRRSGARGRPDLGTGTALLRLHASAE